MASRLANIWNRNPKFLFIACTCSCVTLVPSWSAFFLQFPRLCLSWRKWSLPMRSMITSEPILETLLRPRSLPSSFLSAVPNRKPVSSGNSSSNRYIFLSTLFKSVQRVYLSLKSLHFCLIGGWARFYRWHEMQRIKHISDIYCRIKFPL